MNTTENLTKLTGRRLAAFSALVLAMYGILAAITFLAAGRWDLPFFWIVFASQAVLGLIGMFTIDQDLISERIRPRGKDQDPYGPAILSVLFLLTLILAALDVGRWHISDHLPPSIQMIGFFLQIAGWSGFYWAMMINSYFSAAIRLQPDRQQTVIDSGPYQWARHPGYAFGAIAFVSQCIAFGSLISLIPAVAIIVDLIHRTLLEERILKEGLPGYSEYMTRVRFRWIPGIW